MRLLIHQNDKLMIIPTDSKVLVMIPTVSGLQT